MLSDSSLPIESCLILLVFSGMPSFNGTVLVITTSSSADFSIRSGAGPLNKPWVAKAKIFDLRTYSRKHTQMLG